MVKDLTGGEQIAARRMREDFWYFEPTHKIIMQGNHKPTIVGQDEGIWRRIKVVPWKVCIPKEERDPDLVEKLMVELPGILRWAVEGCLAWQTDGLGLRSDLLEGAIREYRLEQKHLGNIPAILDAFFTECLDQVPDEKVARSIVFGLFEEWRTSKGYPSISATKLAYYLTSRGVKDGGEIRLKNPGGPPGSPTRAWHGLQIKKTDSLDS